MILNANTSVWSDIAAKLVSFSQPHTQSTLENECKICEIRYVHKSVIYGRMWNSIRAEAEGQSDMCMLRIAIIIVFHDFHFSSKNLRYVFRLRDYDSKCNWTPVLLITNDFHLAAALEHIWRLKFIFTLNKCVAFLSLFATLMLGIHPNISM